MNRPFWRCADAHTPMTGEAAIGSVGTLPSAVSRSIGTWMAIVWTLNARSALNPSAAGLGLAGRGIRWRFWNGRRAPRSNTEPRST